MKSFIKYIAILSSLLAQGVTFGMNSDDIKVSFKVIGKKPKQKFGFSKPYGLILTLKQNDKEKIQAIKEYQPVYLKNINPSKVFATVYDTYQKVNPVEDVSLDASLFTAGNSLIIKYNAELGVGAITIEQEK